MKKTILLFIFLVLNSTAAFCAFTLWNSSSLAAASVAIMLCFLGGLGNLLGGYLAGKTLYVKPLGYWGFAISAVVFFLAVFLSVLHIEHPSAPTGPFPTNPWHEYGFVWIYLVITTLWMLVQATRTK